MGWSFSCNDTGRKAHTESLTSARHFSPGYTPITHRVVGNHVWQLVQRPDGTKFITLDLIAKERGGGWGYKNLDEDWAPYFLTVRWPFLTGWTRQRQPMRKLGGPRCGSLLSSKSGSSAKCRPLNLAACLLSDPANTCCWRTWAGQVGLPATLADTTGGSLSGSSNLN